MRKVVVDERGQREGKTSLSMFMGAGRVISFPYYACFRGMDAHETDVRLCGKFEERTKMVVPFYDFLWFRTWSLVSFLRLESRCGCRGWRTTSGKRRSRRSRQLRASPRYRMVIRYRGFVGTGPGDISPCLDLRLGVYRVSAEVYRFSQFPYGLRGP